MLEAEKAARATNMEEGRRKREDVEAVMHRRHGCKK
jgi:hypothetical protein